MQQGELCHAFLAFFQTGLSPPMLSLALSQKRLVRIDNLNLYPPASSLFWPKHGSFGSLICSPLPGSL